MGANADALIDVLYTNVASPTVGGGRCTGDSIVELVVKVLGELVK